MDMARESHRRGHDVTILAGEHKGDQDGVKLTSDGNSLLQPWDLIIVHGCDVGVQNFVLGNASKIPSPILYMIILPSGSVASVNALHNCAYVSYCTSEDAAYVNTHNMSHKAFHVRVSIDPHRNLGAPGFKEKYNITAPRMFLSCGGYWPNKAMIELAKVFDTAKLDNTILVTTGYDNRNNLMPLPSEYVTPLLIEDKNDVLSAIVEADAYIMHSYSEGFGTVLLESMLNNTPWIARYGSGAALMNQWGNTYNTDAELLQLVQRTHMSTPEQLAGAKAFALNNYTTANTVDDIEIVLAHAINNRRA
jgi:glycosyltransferase involved in cell wall biosynthesis